MMIPNARESMDAKAHFRTLRILHFVLWSSVLVYGLLAYLMLTFGMMPEELFIGDFPNLNLFRALIWLLAAVEVVSILIIRAWTLNPDALRRHAMHVAGWMNTWYIIMFSLANVIAIYGLMLCLFAALFEDFLVLAGISLLMFYWLRPKKDDYHALVRQARGA